MPTYDQIYHALGEQETGYSDDAEHCITKLQQKRFRRFAAVAIILRDNILEDDISSDSVQIGLSLEEIIAQLNKLPNKNELGGLSSSSVYPVILQLGIATNIRYRLKK